MLNFPRRLARNMDWQLLAFVVAVIAISIVTIGSATHMNTPSDDRFWYVGRQGMFALFNAVIILILLAFDYRNLKVMAKPLYVINMLALIGVTLFGQTALGAQRWIQIGPLNLQPSEFSKAIMIVVLAAFLDNNQRTVNSPKTLLKLALIVGLPFVLVLKQPDLGTAMVFLAITLGMVFVSGISYKYIAGAAVAAIAAFPVVWHFMHDYQKMRLTVFLDPNVDPSGSGYHIIQSKIAIGSGMLFGKGLFHGTQSQLNFLPENHTDFIFAVVGEEFGFIGTSVLLLLYLGILYRMLRIAGETRDSFGMLLASGVFSMFLFHILINIGMTVGLMPVTGIPCPLMSYGVSSLTTNLLCIGIMLNIYIRRKNINF
ncbi:MAG: rod shape-determining protein RodA [Negativicutes bacterium]|jgi:rod shape determining protein RodA